MLFTDKFLVIFYYAGHGCALSNDKGHKSKTVDLNSTYLVPHDADIDRLEASAIDFGWLSRRLSHIKCKQLIMIFDCCHSGAMDGRSISTTNTRQLGPLFIEKDYLYELAGEGKAIITACTGQQSSYEEDVFCHGAFTYYIIEGLNPNPQNKWFDEE